MFICDHNNNLLKKIQGPLVFVTKYNAHFPTFKREK